MVAINYIGSIIACVAMFELFVLLSVSLEQKKKTSGLYLGKKHVFLCSLVEPIYYKKIQISVFSLFFSDSFFLLTEQRRSPGPSEYSSSPVMWFYTRVPLFYFPTVSLEFPSLEFIIKQSLGELSCRNVKLIPRCFGSQ